MDAAELLDREEPTRKSRILPSEQFDTDITQQDIAQQPGPQQKRATTMYTELRKNLVDTVYESWRETGFAWEQYNPDTGAGQRTQHFTGWTSMVVKIMNFPDLTGKSGGHDEL
jgi:mannosyl-oligosaccharide glucosidase